MKYKECFEIMGNDRNSYSETDLEATCTSEKVYKEFMLYRGKKYQ